MHLIKFDSKILNNLFFKVFNKFVKCNFFYLIIEKFQRAKIRLVFGLKSLG